MRRDRERGRQKERGRERQRETERERETGGVGRGASSIFSSSADTVVNRN